MGGWKVYTTLPDVLLYPLLLNLLHCQARWRSPSIHLHLSEFPTTQKYGGKRMTQVPRRMPRVIPLILVLAVSHATAARAQFLGCPLIEQITLEDCQVLEKLFYETDGFNWRNVRGWLRTNQPCDWYGITCQSSDWPRDIIHIDLSGNDLTGTLPGDLAFLSELRSIRIDNTGPGIRQKKLIHQIPNTLGDLEHLEVLLLGNNAFTGTIPPELGNLTNLRELSLGDNKLEGPVPERFGQLTELQHLDLRGNSFGGAIPDSLRHLAKLEHLDLSQNLFSGTLPTWLGDFSELKFLDVSNNMFSGTLPEALIQLGQLVWLSLANNDLEGALSLTTATYAAGITNCHLEGNRICIPDAPPYANLQQVCSLSQQSTCKVCQGVDCQNLESVYFETSGASWVQSEGWLASSDPCDWHGISCHNEEITRIVLSDNRLTGDLPQSLSSLPNLQVLNLSKNNLQGNVPQEYAGLTHLVTLDLSDNELTGILPLQVAALGAMLNQCSLSENAGICLPDNAMYAALNANPICQLPLRKDCRGYDFVGFNDLRAIPGERSVQLVWSTTQSSVGITFVIERIEPLVILAEVPGNEQVTASFTYTIDNLDPGQYSFQIRQVTASGAYRVSEPITVELYAEDLVIYAPYPNPFSAETIIEFTSGTSGSVVIALSDLAGRRIQTLFSGTPALHQPTRIVLDAKGLASGTYFIHSFLDGRPISSEQITRIR